MNFEKSEIQSKFETQTKYHSATGNGVEMKGCMQLITYLGQPESSFRVCLIKLWLPEAGAVGLFEVFMIICIKAI